MRFFMIVGFILSLTQVATAQQLSAPPTITFGDSSVYKVDATSLDVEILDRTPREYPQVGHLSKVTFEQATRAWAVQRFQLTGNSVNKLRITLREGRITEKILPIQKGIRGWFKKEESVQYEGALSLEVAIIDVNGAVLTKAEAGAMMSQSLIEGATQTDKETVWLNIVNTTFNNADRELKPRISETMNRFIN